MGRPKGSALVFEGERLQISPYSWETRDELHFIHQVIAHRLRSDAVDFLKGYRAASELRTDWGRINQGAVLEYIERQIAERAA